MFTGLRRSYPAAVAALALGACATPIIIESRPAPVVVSHHQQGRRALGVPPGHLPPPGSCRVWYPGRPPGHQPPPTSCARSMRIAPLGAWVLYRPRRNEVHTRVMHPRRAGHVSHVDVYVAVTGVFVRSER